MHWLLGAVAAMLLAASCSAAPAFSTFELAGYDNPVTGVWFEAGEARSAVPLGGLGTGFIELNSEGKFENSTLQGNPRPTGRFPNSFLAVRAQAAGKAVTRMLQCDRGQALGPPDVESVAEASYFGHYPIVDLRYRAPELPVDVSLRALTPFILGDSRHSGLPAAIFRVSMTNRTQQPLEATALLSWENDLALPGKETGNVGGFLMWQLGDLAPGQEKHCRADLRWAPFVEGLATRTEPATDLRLLTQALAEHLSESTELPATPGTQAEVRSPGVADVFMDGAGGFNWEARGREAFTVGGTGNIGQAFYSVAYEADGRRRVGTDFRPGQPSALIGLQPKRVRLAPQQDWALAEATTDDGRLLVSVIMSAEPGAAVARAIGIRNLSQQTIRRVEVSQYVNLDVGGPEACDDNEGWFDPKLRAIVARNRTSGAAMCLAGLDEPTGYGLGPWHETLNRMHAGTYDPVSEAVVPDDFPKCNRPGTPSGVVLGIAGHQEGYALDVVGASSRARGLCAASWTDLPALWADFATDGLLSGPIQGAGNAAVAATVGIAPGKTEHVDFALAWYFPDLRDADGKRLGHRYATWFRSAEDVLRYVAAHADELVARTIGWQDELYGRDIPGWLQDALINSLYSLARNTWWIEDGRFAHSESFTGCPIMETIVCRFNGSWPLATFFPDRERNTMMQFCAFQRPDGAIPFAFGGGERLDAPYYETQKSLDSSEFVLMCYRDWRLLDETFLRRVYLHVRQAIRYCQTLDTDGDGIINEVSMQYYDQWQFHGTSAYVGSIWLAALKAAAQMARQMGDPAFAGECEGWFAQAQASFERKLWNGSYYRLYHEPETGNVSEVSLGSQLAGQWFAYASGLGEVLPHDHILSAVDSVLRLNGANTPYGVANGVTPDGQRLPGPHSDCVSPGESFSFAATAIFAGRKEQGLKEARETYENIALRQRSPWNIYFNFSAADGSMIWGSHYYSNMSVWTLLTALEASR